MRHSLLTLSILVLLGMLPAQVHSAINVRVEDVTVVNGPGGVSGFFDVFAEVTAPIENISGWQFKINLASNGLDVALTSVGATTAPHPNVFTDSPTLVNPITPTMAEVTNLLLGPGANTPLDDQDGFVRVSFFAQPGVVGTFDVTIDPSMSFINDDTTPDPVEMPFTITNGSINVVVPEPSSVIVWGLMVAGVLGGTVATVRTRRLR